jgi:hypothetical protein
MSFAELLQSKLGEHLTENVIYFFNIHIILIIIYYLLKIDRRINP